MKVKLLVAAAIVSVGAVSAHDSSETFARNNAVIVDSPEKTSTNDHAASISVVPPRFSSYDSVEVGEGITCVVGAVSDEDGMTTSPHVYLSERSVVRWSRSLEIPSGFYQGRSTHCLMKGGSFYVLIQVDTHSEQSLSQTLLQIVRLGQSDGHVEDARDVNVPNLRRAYSSWVAAGSEHFLQIDDAVRVTGRYRLLDSEEVKPFSAVVSM